MEGRVYVRIAAAGASVPRIPQEARERTTERTADDGPDREVGGRAVGRCARSRLLELARAQSGGRQTARAAARRILRRDPDQRSPGDAPYAGGRSVARPCSRHRWVRRLDGIARRGEAWP